MIRNSLFLGLMLFSLQAASANNITYLACPGFDERAPDLMVVLDPSNGKASLQAPSMGSGLNFTTSASFGPDKVVWSRESTGFKHVYSVDRESLIFERKTYSERTGTTDLTKANCKIVKKNKHLKF